MITLLDDRSVLHDQDHICLADRGQSMCNDKTRSALHHRCERILDLDLRSCIDGRSRLIKDQHRWQAEHQVRREESEAVTGEEQE